MNLPDFTGPVVEGLIQFLYTGSVVLHSSLRDDFIALCNELRINFPEEILETPPVTVLESPAAEVAVIKLEDDSEMLVEEYEETDQDYVEQEEPDEENFDEPEDSSSSTQNFPCEDTASPARLPLYKQIGTKHESRQSKSLNITSPNSAVPHANIQEALDDIANGLNTMEAARRYGIPKTTLYRWAKKAKVK